MDVGKLITGIVVAVCVIIIGMIVAWNCISIEGAFYKHFNDVRRDAYESTKSYVDGKAQQLAKYQYEYNTGDESTKIAVSTAVRHLMADYDSGELTPELQKFVKQCRGY